MSEPAYDDESDYDCDMELYYVHDDDCDVGPSPIDDAESFKYDLLNVEDVDLLLNKSVEAICEHIKISPSLAKLLLHTHKWSVADIISKHRQNAERLLVDAHIKPQKRTEISTRSRSNTCSVCVQPILVENCQGLNCGHLFCRECWQGYFHVQIQAGFSTGLECMAQDCRLLVPEDFVLNLVTNSRQRIRYQEFAFRDYVESHPQLRFCPGPNCQTIVRAEVDKAKRVTCNKCSAQFCFQCGIDYHAPTACDTIKRWLTKCADDSETANYISAHTKDCPKCHVCIEKAGGCNHMQCYKCKHDFCWMCLGEWKTHGSEYYECSRYKENPNIVNESAHAQAREALKKYLFYFERWENHSKSLQLEEQTLCKIRARIEENVMKQNGTWIDWQYLLDAAALLRKCRYTLQYTYPYAYYMGKDRNKELFEYQQAQLEAEVENLSWKVERAEITDRGDLENQMDIAEKRRVTLVKAFLGM